MTTANWISMNICALEYDIEYYLQINFSKVTGVFHTFAMIIILLLTGDLRRSADVLPALPLGFEHKDNACNYMK